MARVNVEDSIWLDGRVLNAVMQAISEIPKMKGHIVARDYVIGALVRAWRIAQEYWCNQDDPRQPIPTTRWDNENLPELLIDVGLARKTDHGIVMAGAETNFSWWFKKVEAGRKGGEQKALNQKLAEASSAKHELAEASSAKHELAEPSKSWQNVANRTQFSSSSSFSDLNTIYQSNLGESGAGLRPSPPPAEAQGEIEGCSDTLEPPTEPQSAGKPPKRPRTKSAEKHPALSTRMIEAYAESHSKPYPQSPRVEATAKLRSQMALIRRLCASDEEAVAFCAWYPTHSQRVWDAKRSHDVATLVAERVELLGYFRTGRNPDTTAAALSHAKRAVRAPVRSQACDDVVRPAGDAAEDTTAEEREAHREAVEAVQAQLSAPPRKRK